MFKHLKPHQSVEALPPTSGAIEQHILRSHLQCNIWRQLLVAHPILLDPTMLGWSRNDMGLKPVLSSVPPAPEATTQLIICNCSKSECGGRCKCRQNNLSCTDMCKCEAEIDRCRNHTVVPTFSDIEEE